MSVRQRQTRFVRLPPVLLVSSMVSACAISTPATITSTQSRPLAITSIQLLNDGDDKAEVGNLRARFHDELTQQLRARGIAVEAEAQYVADFAVSERDAEVGLKPVSDTDDTAEPIEPSIRSRWYHKCRPTRVSASMVIYGRADGAVKAKSAGEFMACPDDMSQLGDLAKILVDRTVSN